MKTKNIFKSTLLTAALLMAGGNVWAEGNLTTVNIGQDTVNLPIDYDSCQTNYSGKIKDGHFDSMKNGNFALYQINNSKEGAFAITFKAATKRGSEISLTFQILDNEDNVVVSEVTSDKIINSGAWDAFLDYSSILSKIPAGESKLKIIFNSSDGDYTANVMDITLTPSDKVTYSVTATVTPENSGTVSGAGTFAEGSDVVLTATPKWGYQFSKWTIGNNDYTDNPYTISNLSANVNVTAVFVEGYGDFIQDVPGELDIHKTDLSGGNINDNGYWENNKHGDAIKYLINVTEAGYYSIIAGIGTKNDSVTINATITNSSNESVLNKTLDVANNGNWSKFENKYTWGCYLAAGEYTLVFTSYIDGSGNTLNMKDVTIAKSDNVSYTIPSDGIGTYCSNFNLDFSGTGATPYIITDGTITDGKIKAVSVNSVVPAGTGIIIKGTAGEISIPVSNTTPASVEGNKLVGVVAATKVEYEAANSYYVMMSGSLAKVTESGIIAANRAYLFLPGVASAKSLELSFDGETTGIETVQGSEFTVNDANSPAYNLSGQRISKGYKGIVIKNGKKFMMK